MSQYKYESKMREARAIRLKEELIPNKRRTIENYNRMAKKELNTMRNYKRELRIIEDDLGRQVSSKAQFKRLYTNNPAKNTMGRPTGLGIPKSIGGHGR